MVKKRSLRPETGSLPEPGQEEEEKCSAREDMEGGVPKVGRKPGTSPRSKDLFKEEWSLMLLKMVPFLGREALGCGQIVLLGVLTSSFCFLLKQLKVSLIWDQEKMAQ